MNTSGGRSTTGASMACFSARWRRSGAALLGLRSPGATLAPIFLGLDGEFGVPTEAGDLAHHHARLHCGAARRRAARPRAGRAPPE